MPLEGLGMPLCAFQGFSSPSARLGPAGGVEEPLVVHSVHASSLLSPWFIRGLGIRELLSCSELLLLFFFFFFCPDGSPSSSLYVRRGDGVGVSSERFLLCSRLSLPPHFCKLGEVVRRVRLPSAAPVRIPPWPPDLRLERQGGYLSPLLVEWLSFAVLLLALSLRLPLSGRDALSVDRLVSCFPLCGRCAIVGGLRTANTFPAFALVVSVGPVAVF